MGIEGIEELKPDPKKPVEVSNLVLHAKQELEALGEEPYVVDWYLRVIGEFASFGHSGGSHAAIMPVLFRLLNFENLTPLTDNPDEWIHHGEDVTGETGGMWQSKRNSEAFSDDGGKTYYLLSEGGNFGNRKPKHETVRTNG